jgi:WD40 repeat protein/serine/threonine protein kinase
MSDKPSIDSIFCSAIEIESPDERRALVEQVCGDDLDLRHQVERLLHAHFHGRSILDAPVQRVATVDEPLRETAGTVIGPYKLLEQIGEGGMGAVWMAEQKEPIQRRVAVKVIKAGMDSKQVLARFEAERQALALMDHPNIAKVLDAGATPDGRPYFVMELVKGVPITQFCDERRLTPRQRLELFIPVCQALQHAHQKGVIHRDVKPSNVLVALYDDRPVPKVIDFGVAKAAGQQLTEKTLHTGFGAVVGTVEYMSPEQAGFNQLDVDTRSDIYSLGVLLYELLTGSPPFTHKELATAGVLEMLRVIREQEPSKPSTKLSTAEGLPTLAANRGTEPAKLTKLVRGELDWIVMKALEKDRNRRYETANGFATDVQRYLADEPVQACPPSRTYRLGKFLRRNKIGLAVVGLVALGLVLIVAVLSVATFEINAALLAQTQAYQDLDAAKQDADTANTELGRTLGALTHEQHKTKSALDQERLALYSYRIALAYREWEAGRVGRAEFLLGECPGHLRGWEWHYLKRQCHLDSFTFRGHGGAFLTGVTFVGDGSLVASRSANGLVKVWNPIDGRETMQFTTHRGHIHALSDGDGRLAEGEGENVFLYDLAAGNAAQRIHLGKWRLITWLVFSPGGKRIATGCGDSGVQVWDVATGQKLLEFLSKGVNRWPIAFSQDGKGLILVENDDLVVRDSATGDENARWRCLPRPESGVILPGQRLATRDLHGNLKVWDLSNSKLLWERRQLGGTIASMAPHPSGAFLATGHEDQTIKIWNVETGTEWFTIRGHTGFVSYLAFRSDGNRLVSGSQDCTVKIWDTTALGAGTPPGVRAYRLHPPGDKIPISCISLSRDARYLAAYPAAGQIAIWDTGSGAMKLFPVDVRTGGPHRVALSPDGQQFATDDQRFAPDGQRDYSVLVRSSQTGDEVAVCSGHQRLVRDVVFSPDGRLLATAADDGTVKLWDPATGKEMRTLPRSFPSRLTFSPDGARLASTSASSEDMVRLWDVTTGEVVWKSVEKGGADDVAFDHDGARLAVASRDRNVRILDARTGEERLALGPHGSLVIGVAFHPEGKRLAARTQDGSVVIWDLTTGRETLTLPGEPIAHADILFGRDGRWLVRGIRDGAVWILDATPLPAEVVP